MGAIIVFAIIIGIIIFTPKIIKRFSKMTKVSILMILWILIVVFINQFFQSTIFEYLWKGSLIVAGFAFLISVFLQLFFDKPKKGNIGYSYDK